MKIAFRMASPTSPTILEKLTDSFEAVQEAMTPSSKGNSEASASDSEEAKPAEAEAEEAPAEEAEAKPPKKKKERQIPIPKDSASFFRVRAKHVKMFQFTADGNLQVPEMRGEPAKVIEIPYYRPATANEIAIDEAKQIEEIQAVEREFDETYTLLKKAVVEWRETRFSADIIKYQRDLQRLDAQRTQLRYPVRWTKTFKNLSVNEILLTEIYEGRKLGYPVDALRTRGIAFDRVIRSDGFKKPVPEAEGEEGEEGEASEEEVEGEDFIIFSAPTDPDHGALSPDTMVEFIYNSTKYNCVLQAYEGERLTMLGRQDVRPTLLKSRNPRQMRVIASRVVGQVEKPRELLIEILKSLLTQHPRFAEVLRATGTATLVFAEAKDGILGVGMNPTDPQVTEREAWKGTNLLGQAWTAARASLPPLAEGEGEGEEAEEAPVQSGGYTEHGKTMAESKEQRRKVLAGFYRRSKA
jgi:predicted NAD-dependent protein-ADP-ribosyltransferase YbiA (DUF1768 family)